MVTLAKSTALHWSAQHDGITGLFLYFFLLVNMIKINKNQFTLNAGYRSIHSVNVQKDQNVAFA